MRVRGCSKPYRCGAKSIVNLMFRCFFAPILSLTWSGGRLLYIEDNGIFQR